ncbi:MAG: hypA [Firmicutes bacterium]|nr:hypA [Bacillota bacterium]
MHELSIMESVLNMVRESAKQRNIERVNKLKLVIGKLSMVLPDSLQFCFQVLSQDDMFRGTVLEIESREAKVKCAACQEEFMINEGYCFICLDCGSTEIEIVSGREMYLDYYEGDTN